MDTFKKIKYNLDNIDSELDPVLDNYLCEQYYYIFQISGFYPYLRNGKWIIALLQNFIFLAILFFNIYLFILPVPELFEESFVIFSQNLHFAVLGLYVIFNLGYIQLKRRNIYKIWKAIATTFFDYNEPFQGDVATMKKEMIRQRKVWIFVPLSNCLAAGAVLLFAPIIDTYGQFNFDKISTSVNLKMMYPFVRCPFSLETDLVYYFVFIIQLSGFGLVLLFIGAGLLAYIIMSQHIILEMRVLKKSIRNVEIRALMMVSSIYNKELDLPDHLLYKHPFFITCYEKCLKKNFQHHQVILRFFDDWRCICSYMVITCYILGSIIIALSLISTGSWIELPGTTISSIAICVIEVIILYTVFYLSQQITDMNDELRDEMYNTKWYYCNASIRRSITIFQVMTLRPMLLKGGGIVPANMTSFTKVVNGAYSYYNMVNAIKQK